VPRTSPFQNRCGRVPSSWSLWPLDAARLSIYFLGTMLQTLTGSGQGPWLVCDQVQLLGFSVYLHGFGLLQKVSCKSRTLTDRQVSSFTGQDAPLQGLSLHDSFWAKNSDPYDIWKAVSRGRMPSPTTLMNRLVKAAYQPVSS